MNKKQMMDLFDELAEVFSLAASSFEDRWEENNDASRANRSLCHAISGGFESRAREFYKQIQLDSLKQSTPNAEG